MGFSTASTPEFSGGRAAEVGLAKHAVGRPLE